MTWCIQKLWVALKLWVVRKVLFPNTAIMINVYVNNPGSSGVVTTPKTNVVMYDCVIHTKPNGADTALFLGVI